MLFLILPFFYLSLSCYSNLMRLDAERKLYVCTPSQANFKYLILYKKLT